MSIWGLEFGRTDIEGFIQQGSPALDSRRSVDSKFVFPDNCLSGQILVV